MNGNVSAIIYAPFLAASAIATIVNQVGLSDLVAISVIILGGFITLRLNIGKTWQANYEAEKEARMIAERERDDVKVELVKAETDLKILEGKTDLSAAMAAISTTQESVSSHIETNAAATIQEVTSALHEHERRAEERHSKTIEALSELAAAIRDFRTTSTAT